MKQIEMWQSVTLVKHIRATFDFVVANIELNSKFQEVTFAFFGLSRRTFKKCTLKLLSILLYYQPFRDTRLSKIGKIGNAPNDLRLILNT